MGLRAGQRAPTASPTASSACSSSSLPGASPLVPSSYGRQGEQGLHTAHRYRGIRISSGKVMLHTKTVLSKQAKRLAKKADEHEQLIMKVTYSLGVLGFGFFCYMLGARPHDIPLLYAAFFIVAAPLRWVYYRAKKWHYFLLDFCYYANFICTFYLLFFSKSAKLFLLCFAFSEGPLAWALIVWRCSLVFSSVDKIVSVLIHLLPGTVIFIIRWWDPITFAQHPVEDGSFGPWPAWPQVESSATLWLWMFAVPLGVYALWQLLYLGVVHGLRNQRLHQDPEVLTSFRELARKASRANNFWWRLSGALGDDKRHLMYALIQAVFTVLTMALTVPMFLSYRLHAGFQFFKIMTSIWNGGNFFFDVMPKIMHAKATARKQLKEQQARQQTQGGGAHEGGPQREEARDGDGDGDGDGASEQGADSAPGYPEGRGAGRGGREGGGSVERRRGGGAGAAARPRQEEGFRERRSAGAPGGSPHPHQHRQLQQGQERQHWDEQSWQGDDSVSYLQRAATVGGAEAPSYPQPRPESLSQSQSLLPLPPPTYQLPPLALEGEGGACRTCGRCGPSHPPASLGAPGPEDGEHFHPASSEPLWMDGGMSAWGEGGDATGARGEEGSACGEAGAGEGAQEGGLRRRVGTAEQGSQDGLEMERSIWRGSGGSVACMG